MHLPGKEIQRDGAIEMSVESRCGSNMARELEAVCRSAHPRDPSGQLKPNIRKGGRQSMPNRADQPKVAEDTPTRASQTTSPRSHKRISLSATKTRSAAHIEALIRGNSDSNASATTYGSAVSASSAAN
jgi:hypothetical protein